MSTVPIHDTAVASQPNGKRADSRWVTTRRCETTWSLRAEVVECLLDESGLRSCEWEPHREVIKSGPHREVSRVDLPSGSFYVKHYRIPGIRAFLQNLIRPSKAMLEWRMVQRVANCGLPTFEAVALGESRRFGVVWDNYLVSRTIEDAEPLNRFCLKTLPGLTPQQQGRIRRQLAVALGRLAGKMHNAGLIHHDFHAGNILIKQHAGGPPELWIIDLHAAQFQVRLTQRDERINLSLLNQFFATSTSKSDRWRFFKTYWTERGRTRMSTADRTGRIGADDALHSAARKTQVYCWKRAFEQWQRKDRKMRRGTRHLLELDVRGLRCRGVATLGQELVEQIRNAPEELFAKYGRSWDKHSENRRVAAVSIPTTDGPLEGYWKSVNHRGLFAKLRLWLRRSNVRRAWEMGHALRRRGICTPQPLMFVESSRGSGAREYLLTTTVPGSITLHEFFRDLFPTLSAPERQSWLRRFTKRFAVQLRWLHRCGYDHRDLKSKNILVSTDPASDESWLLDLEAVRHWTWHPPQRVVQNLSRLHVTSLKLPGVQTTDRLRFLKWYLGPQFQNTWKSQWRKIVSRAQRKVEQNRRNRRPLT